MELPIIAPAPVVTAHAAVFRDLVENPGQFRHVQHYLTGLILLPNKRMANIARIHPENVVDLHAEAKRTELRVRDLRGTFYGMKDFEVRDPDGHILWFGQGTDEPPTSEGQSR
jgi:hypothetical protein